MPSSTWGTTQLSPNGWKARKPTVAGFSAVNGPDWIIGLERLVVRKKRTISAAGPEIQRLAQTSPARLDAAKRQAEQVRDLGVRVAAGDQPPDGDLPWRHARRSRASAPIRLLVRRSAAPSVDRSTALDSGGAFRGFDKSEPVTFRRLDRLEHRLELSTWRPTRASSSAGPPFR